MGILKNLRSWIGGGSLTVYDDFWYNAVGAPVSSGQRVNTTTAMRLAAFYACVSLIAETKAALPLTLFKSRKGGGKDKATAHPLYHLLKYQPNPEMTSYTWRETGQGHLLCDGNKYGYIERSMLGVKAIHLLHPKNVTPKRIKKTYAGKPVAGRGQIVYEVKDGNGTKKTYPARDILHVLGFGFDGLKGESVITNFARETIGIGQGLSEFEGKFFKQGMAPGGVFEFPEGYSLGDKKKSFIDAIKRRFGGSKNAHLPMVLENGGKYHQYDIKMADAQFLELTRATKIDICGILKVPPSKISIHGTNTNYNNTEQENLSFVQTCLLPWLVRDEQEMTRKLLTPDEVAAGYFIKYNVSGLLRGDVATRGEFYQKVFGVGGISPNMIAALEDWDPVPGGDQRFVPLNFIPIGQAGEAQQQKAKEVKSLPRPERRSIVTRDRIARQYHPLFLAAAEKIVNLEANAIARKVNKYRTQRAKSEMQQFLTEFYRDFGTTVKKEIGPVIRSYADAVGTASGEEIGVEPSGVDVFAADYVDTYAERHVGSSKGQMEKLLKEKDLDDLETRADEWREKRPEKIAINETTRAASAIFQLVAFGAGMATVWRIRGAETCKYCKELNGRAVRSGETFVADGDEVVPEGEEPMKVRGMKAHPPLHAGCDCYLQAG